MDRGTEATAYACYYCHEIFMSNCVLALSTTVSFRGTPVTHNYLLCQKCLEVLTEPLFAAPECSECGQEGDDRTREGMKCGRCAYGAT